MTKREFIQQAAIQIGAALAQSYPKVKGGYLTGYEVRERITKDTMRVVSRLADEVGRSQPWDFDFDDLDIDEEVSMEYSV